MRFETKDWVVKVKNGKFKPVHVGCDKAVLMFKTDYTTSPYVNEHDEESYCGCGCKMQSPPLKDFKIIAESIEEKEA